MRDQLTGNPRGQSCAPHSPPGLDAVFFAGTGLGAPQPAWYPVAHMEAHWAHCLLRRPDDLSCHIRRINFWLERPGALELAAALLDLFIVLGERNAPLRARLLGMAANRLPTGVATYLAAPRGTPPMLLPNSLFANQSTYPGGPRLERNDASDATTSVPDHPLIATPAGAYFAVCAAKDDPLRDALLHLLARPVAWPVRAPAPATARAEIDPAVVGRLLAQEWATRVVLDRDEPWTGPLEPRLVQLLPELSDSGCALVADEQGLRVASTGFSERKADELAALSAEAVALGLRHRNLLAGDQPDLPAAWAMVDAAGNSQIGVWPIFVGPVRFALVIAGRPLFTGAAFVPLIRTLVRRVASSAAPTSSVHSKQTPDTLNSYTTKGESHA